MAELDSAREEVRIDKGKVHERHHKLAALKAADPERYERVRAQFPAQVEQYERCWCVNLLRAAAHNPHGDGNSTQR